MGTATSPCADGGSGGCPLAHERVVLLHVYLSFGIDTLMFVLTLFKTQRENNCVKRGLQHEHPASEKPLHRQAGRVADRPDQRRLCERLLCRQGQTPGVDFNEAKLWFPAAPHLLCQEGSGGLPDGRGHESVVFLRPSLVWHRHAHVHHFPLSPSKRRLQLPLCRMAFATLTRSVAESSTPSAVRTACLGELFPTSLTHAASPGIAASAALIGRLPQQIMRRGQIIIASFALFGFPRKP